MKYKISIQDYVNGTVQTTEYVAMKYFLIGVMNIRNLKKRGSNTNVDIVDIDEREDEITVHVEIQCK